MCGAARQAAAPQGLVVGGPPTATGKLSSPTPCHHHAHKAGFPPVSMPFLTFISAPQWSPLPCLDVCPQQLL